MVNRRVAGSTNVVHDHHRVRECVEEPLDQVGDVLTADCGIAAVYCNRAVLGEEGCNAVGVV